MYDSTSYKQGKLKKRVLKILYQQGGPTQQYNGQQGGPTQQQYNPSMYDQQSNKRGGGNLTIFNFLIHPV